MNRTTLILAGLLLAALVFGGVSQRSASYARAESARLGKALDSLSNVKARVDTVHAVTVRTVTRHTASLDTLTLTVDRWKSDTIRVVEYVTRADSLARACTALIESCEARVSVRDSQIVALRAKARADLAIVTAKVPTFTDRLRSAAVWSAAGALAAVVLRP